MTPDTTRWLAEECGWEKYSSDTDKAAVYYTKADNEAAEYTPARGGWTWELKEAGAWDAVVKLGFDMYTEVSIDDPFRPVEGNLTVVRKIGVTGPWRNTSDSDPIKAVEMAVEAMCQERVK